MDKFQCEKFKAALDEFKKHVLHYSVAATTNPSTHQFFDIDGGLASVMISFNHPLPPPPQLVPQTVFPGTHVGGSSFDWLQ